MKIRPNYRLLFLLVLLGGFAVSEVALELRPSLLRPGLHLFAYVGNTGDGTVTVIDLVKLSPVATIPVGPSPSAVRANPSRKEIWGLSSSGRLCLGLDSPSDRVVAHIPGWRRSFRAGFFTRWRARLCRRGQVEHADRNRLRLAKNYCQSRGQPRTIGHSRLSGRKARPGIESRRFHHLRLRRRVPDPSGRRSSGARSRPNRHLTRRLKAFIASTAKDEISVVDLKNLALLTNLSLGGAPNDLILKPDGGELYVPSGDAHGLLVVNTQTNEVGDFLLLGMSPVAGALSADGATLYATDSAAGHIVPVAIGIRQVARPIAIGQSPVTADLTPGGDILAVVDTASDDLAVIRTQTSSLITLIPTGPQPRSLAIKVF